VCLSLTASPKKSKNDANRTTDQKDLATPQETRNTYLTLLTLLFAYAYDARTTQHDPTPESAWTIAALTPAFSALDPPPYHHHHQSPPSSTSTSISTSTSVDDDDAPEHWPTAETLIPSYRRALAFPLHRSWTLAESCRTDAARFLVRGARTVLRCLLELRAILDAHPVYYVYSRVWLDDFCRWIQTCARYAFLFLFFYVVRSYASFALMTPQIFLSERILWYGLGGL
jgi:protein SHQ1